MHPTETVQQLARITVMLMGLGSIGLIPPGAWYRARRMRRRGVPIRWTLLWAIGSEASIVSVALMALPITGWWSSALHAQDNELMIIIGLSLIIGGLVVQSFALAFEPTGPAASRQTGQYANR